MKQYNIKQYLSSQCIIKQCSSRGMAKQIICLLALFMLLPGCGSSDGKAIITGKVVYKGKGAAGAILTFQATSSNSASSGLGGAYSGVVAEDGSLRVQLREGEQPPAPGKYIVLVHWPEDPKIQPAKDTKPGMRKSKLGIPADRLNNRYQDRNNPLITVDLQSGKTDIKMIELSDS